jgi:hypothetical protein
MPAAIALPFQLTKTLVCALYELQAITKVDPLYLPNTTLNHKYNNFGSELPATSPKLAYFGIGTRGFKNLDDNNLAAPYVPSSKNLDLFAPLPFRVVPVANDLSPAERANYRMRILRTFEGQQYWCYYLKKATFINNRVQILKTNLTTGEETVLTELDPANLSPVPTNTSVEDVTQTNEKISVALTANVQITGEEVIEAINVIHGGNLLRSVISEIGLYVGTDKDVSMSNGLGGSFTGTEAIFASLAYHYTSLGTSFSTPSRVENVSIRLNSASAFLI